MHTTTIQPARNFTGAVRPPGDKSISHRTAILAALGAGETKIENYSTGADCASTLACLEALGVRVERDAAAVTLHGVGLHGLQPAAQTLDAGNSGSTLRMLSGVLAAQPFATRIGGDASLNRRPMRRILEPLRRMGAVVEALGPGDCAPLMFHPPAAHLCGINYQLPVASAQVKTAILLAGLYADGQTRVIEPVATRDHTEILLRELGPPSQGSLRALGAYRVPGDPSSAAFFLCAAACFADGDLLVDEVSLNPTRAALLDVMARLGAPVTVVSIEQRRGELVGSLHLDGSKRGLGGTTIAGAEAAALIDEVPILAVLATQTRDGITFEDVGELRVKESDRIAAIAANLRAMGAHCEERPRGISVPGGQKLHGARIESHGDHRIAMAFAVAALMADGETGIDGAECAAISYPEFYRELDRLAER